MAPLSEVSVPPGSALHKSLSSSSFFDAYAAPLKRCELTPTEIFLQAARATPDWVGHAMAIRNAIVSRLGLKDVGNMRPAVDRPGSDYRIGDRMGIFTVFAADDRELVLGIDDSHLDVRVSVLKSVPSDEAHYVVSTVVHVKNWLGRLYMLPVGRIHPFVVRAMMRRAAV